jgi:hypothetical protein
MFKWNDREAARRIYAHYAAEAAWAAVIDLTKDGTDRELDDNVAITFQSFMEDEPGSGEWDKNNGGARWHIIWWAWCVISGDMEMAEKAYTELLLSLKHGGKIILSRSCYEKAL